LRELGSRCEAESEDLRPDNLAVFCTGLVFQEEVILKQRKAQRDTKEGLIEMNENIDSKDKVRV
jgi:hypothetical protein